MTWVRIDEDFAEHPKLVAVGPLGLALQVAALCYSNRNKLDGIIPKGIAARLQDIPRPQRVIDALVKHGVWEVVEDGYFIHDIHDYQPTRAEVMAERAALKAKKSEAGRKGAAKRWQSDSTRDSNGMAGAIAEGMASEKRSDGPGPGSVRNPPYPPSPSATANGKPQATTNRTRGWDKTRETYDEYVARTAVDA